MVGDVLAAKATAANHPPLECVPIIHAGPQLCRIPAASRRSAPVRDPRNPGTIPRLRLQRILLSTFDRARNIATPVPKGENDCLGWWLPMDQSSIVSRRTRSSCSRRRGDTRFAVSRGTSVPRKARRGGARNKRSGLATRLQSRKLSPEACAYSDRSLSFSPFLSRAKLRERRESSGPRPHLTAGYQGVR